MHVFVTCTATHKHKQMNALSKNLAYKASVITFRWKLDIQQPSSFSREDVLVAEIIQVPYVPATVFKLYKKAYATLDNGKLF